MVTRYIIVHNDGLLSAAKNKVEQFKTFKKFLKKVVDKVDIVC